MPRLHPDFIFRLPALRALGRRCYPAKVPFSICARCEIAGLRALAYIQTVAKRSLREATLRTVQIGSERCNRRAPSLIKLLCECVFHKSVVDNDNQCLIHIHLPPWSRPPVLSR